MRIPSTLLATFFLAITSLAAKNLPKHAEPQPAAEPVPAAPAPSEPLDLEFGALFGFNPNVELTRSGSAYLSGTDAFGIPVWTFGGRIKKNFGMIGVRAAVQYSFSPERIHTDSTTATPSASIKESGNSITIPVSFCIIPLRGEKGEVFVGAGLGYSSYTTDKIYTTANENVKTSGLDWNFLFGAEIFINSRFGISLEYVMIRGYDNQASYSRGGSTLTSIAVNRNVDQYLIGANLRL